MDQEQRGFGPPPGGFGPPPGPPQYEFSQLENETIVNTARWAKYLAIALFVYAGYSVVGCNPIFVIGYVAVAVPTFIVGNALQRVNDTRDRDLTNMMEAVRSLGTSFLVRIIVMVSTVALLVLLLLALVFFLGVFAAAIGGARSR